MGFCDASGLEAGGVWLDPAVMGHNLVCQNPLPADVTIDLVSLFNPKDTITNSYLELATLIPQEATLLEAVPKAHMAAPRSGYGNTPTVSSSTREVSIINPVVADLLFICESPFQKDLIGSFRFLPPGPRNCMADDAPRLFSLSDTKFLTHMYAVHPQLHVLWQISLPPPELISCVISTLRRKLCELSPLKMRDSRGYTGSAPTYMPPCWSILLS